MEIGLFAPNYSNGEYSLASLFVDGLAHGLRALDVDVKIFCGDSLHGTHWYELAEEYKSLNALLVPLANDAGLAISRHVTRLFPSFPVLLSGNYFEGTYNELRELSTAKILRAKFLNENRSREDLVNSLADSFERNWNADVYQRVLQIHDDVLPKGQRLYFNPVNSSVSALDAVPLPFPIVPASRGTRVKSEKPFVIVDGGLIRGFYADTVREYADAFELDVVTVGSEITSPAELLSKCSNAELVISLSPLPGYSAAAITALSLGVPLAAASSSSYSDVVVDELRLSPGFRFRESVRRLFAGSLQAGAIQQELVVRHFDSKVIAKQVLGAVKDHSFFLAGKAAQFDKQLAETKSIMLGDPIE